MDWWIWSENFMKISRERCTFVDSDWYIISKIEKDEARNKNEKN